MTQDEIIEKSQNLNVDEIDDIASILKQSIRCALSRFLMDTSEEKPLKVDIYLSSSTQGSSDFDKPHIYQMFQDPKEGIILFRFDGIDDLIDLDEIPWEEQLEIYENLCSKDVL